MKYDGVLFDFDGTIAYTAEDVWLAIEYALEQEGYALPKDYRSDPVNLAKSQKEIFIDVCGELSEEQILRMRGNLNQHYGYITDYPTTYMYDGIEDILKELKKREIPTGIITNKGEHSLMRILQIKGWSSYFTYAYGFDSLGPGHRKASLMADMLEKHFAGRTCIYIGDSYTDVISSRENQIPCLALTYGDGDAGRLKAENPEYVCDTAREAYDVLFN